MVLEDDPRGMNMVLLSRHQPMDVLHLQDVVAHGFECPLLLYPLSVSVIYTTYSSGSFCAVHEASMT